MDSVAKHLVVLYGYGGLSDVGRHAILAGLEKVRTNEISHISVITKFPELLEEENWNCGCEDQPHTFTDDDKERLTIIPIDKAMSWNDCDLSSYLKRQEESNNETTVIVSCIGNRQPFIKHWDAKDGNAALIRGINKVKQADGSTINDNTTASTTRVVILTAAGINEDWPAFEFFWIGKIATILIFTVFARTMYNDLKDMELLYTKQQSNAAIDYLLVRPVGISEDVVPVNSWVIQKEKYKHVLGFEMAKMDVARFMVQEAIEPTRSQTSVVIGSDPIIPVKRYVPKKTTKN